MFIMSDIDVPRLKWDCGSCKDDASAKATSYYIIALTREPLTKVLKKERTASTWSVLCREVLL